MNSPGWEQQEESERRQWDEEQEFLRQDSENYWRWLETLDGQTYEETEWKA